MSLHEQLPLAAGTYPAMAGAVFIGSVVPIIPTGPVVSAAAVLAVHDGNMSLLLVIVISAIAAYLGDIASYGMFRAGGTWVRRRYNRTHGGARLERLQAQLAGHDITVLTTSRLVPGGRIPVLMGAALVGYRWHRYLRHAPVAAVVWSVAYAVLGLLGGRWFSDPWIGAIIAVVLALFVTLAPHVVRPRRRSGGTVHAATRQPPPSDET